MLRCFVLPTEVEEYLCFNADADYANLKFVSAVFDKTKSKLTANYVYTADIEKKLTELKPKLEELFKESVNLPLKYEFHYTKAYMDETVLKLKVMEFLKAKFAIMAGTVGDSDIKIELADNTWAVNLYISSGFANYLEYSKPWQEFKQKLTAENFYEFEFYINVVKDDKEPAPDTDEEPEYTPVVSARVDKVYRVKNPVYLFGRPIKERPIKIEFLTVSPDDQIIAGELSKLTKKEYTAKSGEKKTYFTFVLNDGDNSANCVFFPNKSNIVHFNKLADGDFIIAMGIYGSRNGWKSLNISGVARAEKA